MSNESSSTTDTETKIKVSDLDQVKPADIILTRSKSATSTAIRGLTCGSYSHAILSLKDGRCIEAVPGDGVKVNKLSLALKKATKAVLYRHKFINEEFAAWICHFAKEQKDKGYDVFGAARSGVSTGCGGIFRYTSPGVAVELVHSITQAGQHNERFFCSELIVFAFAKASLPLLDNMAAYKVTPSAIATSSKLEKVQELI